MTHLSISLLRCWSLRRSRSIPMAFGGRPFWRQPGNRRDSNKMSLPEADYRVPLSDVARLSLSIGRLFMEFGESARIIHEEILAMAHCLGCDSAEVYCQHATIIVPFRPG